jgi:large subunit ribosomal protein L17
MYRNLVGDLLQYERIVTTEPKAKEIRGLADKVITLSKAGDLHARRRALTLVNDKKAVDKAFDELAPRYASRSGGYTRVLKLGARLVMGPQWPS